MAAMQKQTHKQDSYVFYFFYICILAILPDQQKNRNSLKKTTKKQNLEHIRLKDGQRITKYRTKVYTIQNHKGTNIKKKTIHT